LCGLLLTKIPLKYYNNSIIITKNKEKIMMKTYITVVFYFLFATFSVAEKYLDIVAKLSEKALARQKTLPECPYDPNVGKNDYPFPTENKK
jgi:hypothetical protein